MADCGDCFKDFGVLNIIEFCPQAILPVAIPLFEATALKSSEGETRDWQAIARTLLRRSLPVNPLSTQPDNLAPDAEFAPIELGWVVKGQDRSSLPVKNHQNLSTLPYFEVCTSDHFLRQVVDDRFSRRIALVGEGGTGKTLLLQQLAAKFLERDDRIPIWISPDSLRSMTLEQFIREKWLVEAIKNKKDSLDTAQEDFEGCLKAGQVWLLIDGIDLITVASTFEPPASPLAAIARQLSELPDRVGVVYTCRSQTWLRDRQTPFWSDVFCTLDLSYPQGVQQFIEQWLISTGASAWNREEPTTTPALFHAIDRPGRETLRSLLANPLRLALLCRWWQGQQGDLPSTRSLLYQALVREFYQWQAELVATLPQQQQDLNQMLAAWAQEMWETHTPFWTSAMDPSPQLRLALQLGWLRPVGVIREDHERRQYVFFDETFQQYFVAQAIADWFYFLERGVVEETTVKGIYRLFEPRWQKVIRFWLGREDIEAEAKTAFIKTAITFDDGCGHDNFYGQQAYFLAVLGLAEFPKCPLAEEMLRQVMAWGFDLKTIDTPLGQAARHLLVETHRPSAIALLLERIATTEIESLYQPMLESLSVLGLHSPEAIATLEQQIANPPTTAKDWHLALTLGLIDPGNFLAIDTFLAPLNLDRTIPVDPFIFSGLEQIAKSHLKAIATLIRRLQTDPAGQSRTFQCLEQIAQNNAMAIAALVQLIRTIPNPTIRRQAAESLEKIDPGNPTAIGVLVQLIQTQRGDIQQQGIFSLGELKSSHPLAIQTLVDLLARSDDLFTQWFAISSLGKIGTVQSPAIPVLVTLIEQSDHPLLRKEALDSLSKIDPEHPVVIQTLVGLIHQAPDEDLRREAADRLGKLDPGNPEAIEVLSTLLKTTEDDFTKRQAAASLGRIDSGNLDALTALIHILQQSPDADLKSLAADSLGEIGHQNPAAIATLIRTIQAASDRELCKRAIHSLGQIASGSRELIDVLVKKLVDSSDDDIREAIVDNLLQVLPIKQMAAIIPTLKARSLIGFGERDLPCHRLLHHCSQHLAYSEFYRAWHQNAPRPARPITDTFSPLCTDLPTLIRESLRGRSSITSQLHLIFIDSSQFVDPEDPSLDIYEQMMAQGCPEFEHGIPDSLPKLKLYWNLSQRQLSPKHLVLIVYDDSLSLTRDLSPHFLEKVSRFGGSVAIVCDRPFPDLPHFSPQDPSLLQVIGDWLEGQIQ